MPRRKKSADPGGVPKPASVARDPFKSAKWDELAAGRRLRPSDVPTLTLLVQWHAIVNRCIEDMDEANGQVAYSNDMSDLKALPQIGIMKQASAEIRALKDGFAARVLEGIPGARLHGTLDAARSLPGIVNFGFDGITGEELLFSLDLEGVCASNGSACSAGSSAPSRTLLAMGLTAAEARGAVRFSFGRTNTADDAAAAFAALERTVARLRSR